MFPYDRSEASLPANTRPRRQRRPPAWVADYEVALPAVERPPPVAALSVQHSQEMQKPYHGYEGTADMRPLTPQLFDQRSLAAGARSKRPKEAVYSGPQHQSTPDPLRSAPELSSAMLEELRQIREDNQRLQLTVMEMQRQLNSSKRPDLSPPPPPPPMTHSPLMQSPVQAAALSPPYSAPQAVAMPVHTTFREEVDDGDWPLPPPPVAEEDLRPQPPTTVLPTNLVAELTSCLKRMGMTPGPPPGLLTPEYCEPAAACHVERSRYPTEPPVHPSPYPSASWQGPPADRRNEDSSSRQQTEFVYRGPQPTIPNFTRGDPREFA